MVKRAPLKTWLHRVKRCRPTLLLAFCLASQLNGSETIRVAENLDAMVDRYLTDIARTDWRSHKERLERIRTPEDVAQQQAYVRTRLEQALGGFPEKTPLRAQVLGSLQRDGYRIEKLVFESLPRLYVTANVYVPTTRNPPFPAVLGTSGHNGDGKAAETYQRAWISMAKRGILVIAYDPPNQGERIEETTDGLQLRGSFGHTMVGIQCLITGSNIARYEVWDGIRAVDYLLTRGDVDPKRIAVTGNSGGGLQTTYLAALEPRLSAAAPGCYITSWERLWMELGPRDSEQNLVGFLEHGLDFSDFLIAAAPRPVRILSALQDFFPIKGARETFDEAKRIYSILGVPDRVDHFEFNDVHNWSQSSREAAYSWMQRWLLGETTATPESSLEIEEPSELNVTRTGQVTSSFDAETIRSLNLAEAERLRAEFKMPSPAELRSRVSQRIRLQPKRGVPESKQYGEAETPTYRIETVALSIEDGILVPAAVIVPKGGAARKPAVLYVQPKGRTADLKAGGDIEALIRAGHLVLAPDLPGWGETRGSMPTAKEPISGRFGLEYLTALRAMLVGKTLVGMRAGSLLRCFDYLQSRSDVDPERIAMLGKGHGGVVTLYAAAMEQRVSRVASEGAITSYMEIVRAEHHANVIQSVVPGAVRDFDLPDLMAAILPRPVWVVAPRSAVGEPMQVDEALREYDVPPSAVLARSSQTAFEEIYKDWISQ